MDLKISSKVEGPEFFYAESHEWHNLSDVAVVWFEEALADLGELAQKLGSKGTGSLTATLTQQWGDADEDVLVIPDFSYADVAKVQRAFLGKYEQIVKIAEQRGK